MKAFILIAFIAFASCCSTRNTTQGLPEGKLERDSSLAANQVPGCIKSLIVDFEKDKVQNPPRSIYRYTYKGKPVYYVPAICCDFFSDLYDADCKLVGHPDGGFTGKGDGKLPDFESAKTDEVLIWKDKRK